MMVRTMESPLAGTATLRETVRFHNSGSNSTNMLDDPSGGQRNVLISRD